MGDRFQRQAAREAAERKEIKGRLAALLIRTPKGCASWSYNTATDFKRAVSKAQSLMSNSHAAVASLREAEGALADFYKE